MAQTRIMSIYRLLSAYAFILGILRRKLALNGNVKHFVFDLTCDVTGNHGVKLFTFI